MRPENTATLFEYLGQPYGIGPTSTFQQNSESTTSKGRGQPLQDLIMTRAVPTSFSVGVAAGTRSLRDIYHDDHDSSIGFGTTMHSVISHRVLRHIMFGDVRRCRSDTESSDGGKSENGESDVERKSASSPRYFRRIIKPSSHYKYLKSPCPGAGSPVELVTIRDSDSSNGSRMHTSMIRTVVRLIGPLMAVIDFSQVRRPGVPDFGRTILDRNPRGSHLYTMGEDGIEFHTVLPIPFNVQKGVRLTTSSIDGTSSLNVTTSPSFRKSCQAVLREARRKFSQSALTRRNQSTGKEHRGTSEDANEHNLEQEENLDGEHQRDNMIRSWLKDIPMPMTSTNSYTTTEPVETFDVWKETSLASRSIKQNASSVNTDILKNITNLRRPGYLNHNSFFK